MSQVANVNSKEEKIRKSAKGITFKTETPLNVLNHMPIAHSHIRVLIEK